MVTQILDIHTHRLEPDGVYDASPRVGKVALELPDTQLFSAGIHPWDTTSPITDYMWSLLDQLLQHPRCVAVGEGGIDLTGKGGLMFQQMLVLRQLVDLSEKNNKPLIVHCVKGEDVILGLKRDLRPTQPWIIHGYRKKPESAVSLLRAGCMLSFGARFNANTLRSCPPERILAETDDSELSIEEIITGLNTARGSDLTPIICKNTAQVLHLTQDPL